MILNHNIEFCQLKDYEINVSKSDSQVISKLIAEKS